MPSVLVPELERKIALLRSYSPHKSSDDLARAFGRAWKTVDWWIRGDDARAADRMPAAALETMIRLFGAILPDCPPEMLRKLVLGPAAQLEDAIRAGSTSLAAMLAREASSGGKIFMKVDEPGLVEIEEEGAPDDQSVERGAWFRIAFPFAGVGEYVLILQNAQHVWVIVPWSVSSDDPRLVHVPPVRANGKPGYMRELRDLGRHRFVYMQGSKPFPVAVENHAREHIVLGRPALDELAAHYAALPAERRACHVLTLSVIDP